MKSRAARRNARGAAKMETVIQTVRTLATNIVEALRMVAVDFGIGGNRDEERRGEFTAAHFQRRSE